MPDTFANTYDYLIIGGGLFGAYSALYLADKGARILMIEKEKGLFRKASIVNQASALPRTTRLS